MQDGREFVASTVREAQGGNSRRTARRVPFDDERSTMTQAQLYILAMSLFLWTVIIGTAKALLA
jgi:hypothetical protein